MTTRPHVYRKGLIFLTEKMYQALILASRCYKRKDGSFTYGHMRAAAKDEYCPSLHIVNQLIHYGVIRKIRGFSTSGRISDEIQKKVILWYNFFFVWETLMDNKFLNVIVDYGISIFFCLLIAICAFYGFSFIYNFLSGLFEQLWFIFKHLYWRHTLPLAHGRLVGAMSVYFCFCAKDSIVSI